MIRAASASRVPWSLAASRLTPTARSRTIASNSASLSPKYAYSVRFVTFAAAASSSIVAPPKPDARKTLSAVPRICASRARRSAAVGRPRLRTAGTRDVVGFAACIAPDGVLTGPPPFRAKLLVSTCLTCPTGALG